MAFIKRLYGEYTLILMVLLLGMGVSAWLAWEYQKNTRAETIQEFKAAAQDRIKLISDKIEHSNIVLRSVGAFFRSSTYISRDEFATYTGQLLKDYPYIHAIEWIPYVMGSERDQYEQQAGFAGFMFKEEGPNGDLVKAAPRDEYFPIYYAEPLENGNKKVLGFDIASDPERFATLRRVRETRNLAATPRVHLLQSRDAKTPGIVFYAPIFLTAPPEPGEPLHSYERLAGVVASVIPLDDMIGAALKPLSYSGVNIVMHDLSAQGNESKLLYVRSTRLKSIPDTEILADFENQALLRQSSVLDVGGRKWEVTIIPTRGYFTLAVTRDTYLIFASGLLITFLLGFYMFARVRENERINQEVNERTAELSKAKRAIEMILLSTHEGIVGFDHAGQISFCNPTASQLLGYRKQELIGADHHSLFHNKHPDDQPYALDECPIQKTLYYGQSCNVPNEVFWHRNGEAIQVEYASSPIYEGGEITGAVLVFRDIAERRALEKKLEQMARYDQLTNLANRALFIELLKKALSRAERTGKKVGVVYMDLNGFKPVNDTLGHAAGDFLLKSFAERLSSVVRNSDIAARMGGDEFTVLVDNVTNNNECLGLIERLQKVLHNPFEIAGEEFTIGASIGISFYPDHAVTYDDLIKQADEAMYHAKKNKALPYVIYNPQDRQMGAA